MTMAERRPNRTLGPGHDDFWAWCDRGELRLQRCTICGKLSWPVSEGCEYCGSGALDWQRMSGRGRIVSWASFVQDYYAGVLPIPYDTILVELEEGVLFTSNPLGFGAVAIEAGMAVTLAFIDCEDGAGRFRLPVFEKV
jgi:uncharacterized OB-fold protein